MPTRRHDGNVPNAPFLKDRGSVPAESYLPKYISPYNYKTTDPK